MTLRTGQVVADPVTRACARENHTMPRLRKGRDRCTARRRDGEPCGAPAIPGGLVCRRHGGSAPQVAIKAEYEQKQLRAFAAGQEFTDTQGTNREFDALCRALKAQRELDAYEAKLVQYYDLRDELRERRAGTDLSP